MLSIVIVYRPLNAVFSPIQEIPLSSFIFRAVN